MKFDHDLWPLWHRDVIFWLLLIEALIHELHFGESLQNERQDNFDRILSKGLADAHSLASEERHETHGIVLATNLESFRFEFIMVLSPLILKVVQ